MTSTSPFARQWCIDSAAASLDAVLEVLAAAEDWLPQDLLATRAARSRRTVVRVLDELEAEGLVVVHRRLTGWLVSLPGREAPDGPRLERIASVLRASGWLTVRILCLRTGLPRARVWDSLRTLEGAGLVWVARTTRDALVSWAAERDTEPPAGPPKRRPHRSAKAIDVLDSLQRGCLTRAEVVADTGRSVQSVKEIVRRLVRLRWATSDGSPTPRRGAGPRPQVLTLTDAGTRILQEWSS